MAGWTCAWSGADRITRTGDVANKIGTYLKALAAHDNGVPFHVAAPVSTIDWTLSDGVREIPIEERSGDEVTLRRGRAWTGGTQAACGSPRRAAPPPTSASTSRRRAWSPAWSPSAARVATRPNSKRYFPSRRAVTDRRGIPRSRSRAATRARGAAMAHLGPGEGRALHRLGAQVVEALHAPLPRLPVQHVQVPLIDVAGQEDVDRLGLADLRACDRRPVR